MEMKEIMQHVDHTLLKPFAAWTEIQSLCEEAIAYGAASVCVPPCYIKRIHDNYGERLNICTVVGFPLGYSTAEAKTAETRQAIADGASEIDMVINIAAVKNGDWHYVTEEIRALRQATGKHILKVIVETCYLTEEEKIAACKAVTDAGADYIKTSTGFGTAGASLDDIRLFRAHIGENVRIKAAGGIRTREAMEAFLEAGCDRIGSSSAAALMKEANEKHN
ncbi:MAG: deoxyribose-phosphate aldolase [Clostridiaceae bacterium]|jgi:deoxyribose-phosphate aldolase|nr:deoxyribose-phosphate aldolase [Clostridiaceae bacterium]